MQRGMQQRTSVFEKLRNERSYITRVTIIDVKFQMFRDINIYLTLHALN